MRRSHWLRTIGVAALLAAAGCPGPSEKKFTHCFVAGTRIATPDGRRPIEELAVGDVVWSWDLDANVPVHGRVSAVHRSTTRDIMRIASGELVIAGVTGRHPFYDAARGDFVPVAELSFDAHLFAWLGSGAPQALPITQRVPLSLDQPVTVFNLSIAETPMYFAEGLLVHNKEPPFVDMDGDGFDRHGADCNDDDPAIHPDAVETCADDIDQNCNYRMNDGCVTTEWTEALRMVVSRDGSSARIEPIGIDLGPVRWAALLGQVDLHGPTRGIYTAIVDDMEPLPADAALPAVIIHTTVAASNDEQFVLVALHPDGARIVWRFTAYEAATSMKAGSITFASTEPGGPVAIEVEMGKSTTAGSDIVFEQRSPITDPKRHHRFELGDDGTYVEVPAKPPEVTPP